MRRFAQLHSSMWQRGTAQDVLKKHGPLHVLGMIYLFSPPLSGHMSGIYYLSLPEMAKGLHLSVDDTRRLIMDLEAEGYCEFDDETSVIFVFKMAQYQIDQDWRSGSKKHATNVRRHLKSLPYTRLIDDFCRFYQFDLDPPPDAAVTPSPLPGESA